MNSKLQVLIESYNNGDITLDYLNSELRNHYSSQVNENVPPLLPRDQSLFGKNLELYVNLASVDSKIRRIRFIMFITNCGLRAAKLFVEGSDMFELKDVDLTKVNSVIYHARAYGLECHLYADDEYIATYEAGKVLK